MQTCPTQFFNLLGLSHIEGDGNALEVVIPWGMC